MLQDKTFKDKRICVKTERYIVLTCVLWGIIADIIIKDMSACIATTSRDMSILQNTWIQSFNAYRLFGKTWNLIMAMLTFENVMINKRDIRKALITPVIEVKGIMIGFYMCFNDKQVWHPIVYTDKRSHWRISQMFLSKL